MPTAVNSRSSLMQRPGHRCLVFSASRPTANDLVNMPIYSVFREKGEEEGRVGDAAEAISKSKGRRRRRVNSSAAPSRRPHITRTESGASHHRILDVRRTYLMSLDGPPLSCRGINCVLISIDHALSANPLSKQDPKTDRTEVSSSVL